MIEFGKTLRAAREAKNYTISQLAEMTHILPHIIEQLERDDFSKIVAPIYGRGFVKLYCGAVGLDPKPLVESFMALYNGEVPEEHDEPAETPPPPPVEETTEDEAPTDFSTFAPPAENADEPPRRDYRLPSYAVTDVPRSFWRFGVLIVAAILVIVGLVFAGRAIYRATMTDPSADGASVPSAATSAAPTGATTGDRPGVATLPRQSRDTPPLYID